MLDNLYIFIYISRYVCMYIHNVRNQSKMERAEADDLFLFAGPIFCCLEAGVGPATLMNLKCVSSPLPSGKF